MRDWLRAYGYRNIRMPIVERTELFVRSIGEVTDIVEKEMYTFVDHLNGESLTLRPEGTASLRARGDPAQPALRRAAAAVLHGPDVPARAPAEGALPAVPPGRRRGAGLCRPGRGRRAHRAWARACGSGWGWRTSALRAQYAGQPRGARPPPRAAGEVPGTARRRPGCGRQAPAAHQSAARPRQQEPGDAGADRGRAALVRRSRRGLARAFRGRCRRSCARSGWTTRSTRGWCAASTTTITPSSSG